jgi:molybdate transport system ATP-binding protein
MLEISARSQILDVELRVEHVLALAGPSGAGKTTLLRAVAGLGRPESGRIECGGETWLDTAAGVDLPPERRRAGLMFQDDALFPHMSALRNVRYAARGDERRARALLAWVRMEHRADERPRSLSGGERQRVALARALASDPRALLLDEPLASVDPRWRARAGRELSKLLTSLHVPTIVVTHDFTEASLLAGEIAVMEAGHVTQRGSASELASSPATGFVADFTGSVVLTGLARPAASGLTEVELDGGGRVVSTDGANVERVAVSVHPWDIALGAGAGSAQNRLPARVVAVTRLGNRTRVGLAAPQALTAEVTTESAERLGLEPGVEVEAVWKAAATRLLPL